MEDWAKLSSEPHAACRANMSRYPYDKDFLRVCFLVSASSELHLPPIREQGSAGESGAEKCGAEGMG